MKIAFFINKQAETIDFKDVIKKVKHEIVIINSVNELDLSFNIVVVFGGDGSILKVAIKAAELNISILGINFGNLGFLTQLKKTDNLIETLNNIENMQLNKRRTIKCIANGNYALNEFVIKSSSITPIYTKLFIDDVYIDNFHGDGLIISTPTGSTAYSLSAGGPVLDPKVEAIAIVPLAAHSLRSRPLVISNKAKIKVEITGENIVLAADGKQISESSKHLEFIVPDLKVNFIETGDDFYSKLFLKLGDWKSN